MKKKFPHQKLLLGVAVVSTLSASPAFAQYMQYNHDKPAVEVDMSILDDAGIAPRNVDKRTYPLVPPVGVVTQENLISTPPMIENNPAAPMAAPLSPTVQNPIEPDVIPQPLEYAPPKPFKRVLKPTGTPPTEAPAFVDAAPVAEPMMPTRISPENIPVPAVEPRTVISYPPYATSPGQVSAPQLRGIPAAPVVSAPIAAPETALPQHKPEAPVETKIEKITETAPLIEEDIPQAPETALPTPKPQVISEPEETVTEVTPEEKTAEPAPEPTPIATEQEHPPLPEGIVEGAPSETEAMVEPPQETPVEEPPALGVEETPVEEPAPALETPPVAEEETATPADIQPPAFETTPPAETVEAPAFAEPAPTVASAVPLSSDLSINFDGHGSDLNAEAEQKLKNLIAQMNSMPETRLQVRAYAAGEDGSKSDARRVSLSRALAVRSYLMDNGIKAKRVDVRAMGTETDRSPVDRVDLIFAR